MSLIVFLPVCFLQFQINLSLDTHHKSLVEAVQVLSAQTNLLDSAQLDHIEGRLTALAQKLNQIAEKGSSVEDTEKDRKVSGNVIFVTIIKVDWYRIVQLKYGVRRANRKFAKWLFSTVIVELICEDNQASHMVKSGFVLIDLTKLSLYNLHRTWKRTWERIFGYPEHCEMVTRLEYSKS